MPGKHWLKQYAAKTTDTLHLKGTIIEITTENFSLLKLASRKSFLGIFLAWVTIDFWTMVQTQLMCHLSTWWHLKNRRNYWRKFIKTEQYDTWTDREFSFNLFVFSQISKLKYYCTVPLTIFVCWKIQNKEDQKTITLIEVTIYCSL